MSRTFFVQWWVKTVAKNRQVHHPSITPAEAAAASVDDQETAKRFRRQHRAFLARVPAEEADRELGSPARVHRLQRVK